MNKITAVYATIRWSLNIALTAMIGYSTMALILSPDQVTLPTVTDPSYQTIKLTTHPMPALDLSDALTAHWFGHPQKAATSARQTTLTEKPPETKLQLTLQGTYHSSKTSFAMITAADNKNAYYTLGQALPGGATLVEIHPHYVILLRQGQHEMLRLVGTETREVAKQSTVATSSTEPNTPEQLLGRYQRQLTTQPDSLIKLLRVAPFVDEAGRFIGYRLRPGEDADLMSQFNLQADDILTNINGVALDSPLKGLEAIQQLAVADRLDLQLLRDGQSFSLSFAIEK